MELVETVETQKFTVVQEGRHIARDLAARAVRTLNGVTGLTQDEQVSRLTHAAELFSEAQEVVQAALKVAGERNYDEYQQTKHQGTEGWLSHVENFHGVSKEELTAIAFGGAEPDTELSEVVLTEAAYQMHNEFLDHAH